MAGRGNSTIARTIARAYDKKQLGANFFSRTASDAQKATKFLSTKFFPIIAVQLAASFPLPKAVITCAVEENKDVAPQTVVL